MSWLRPAAVVLLLSAALLALEGPYSSLCSASAADEALPDALEVEAPAEGEEAAFPYDANENEPLSGEEDDEADGFLRDAAGGAMDRPRDERPMTTKRLYTTRRTNQSASASRSQQLAKLKLAALGAVVLLAVLAVAFRGKFANDEEDDDS
ncbi:hypothetical protein Emag_006103 [Eimeria magna]